MTEGSSHPDIMDPSLGRTSTTPGPSFSDSQQKLPGQADSFLIAARLLRRGWRDQGKGAQWRYSNSDSSTHEPFLSISTGNQDPHQAETFRNQERRSKVSNKEAPEENEPASERKTDRKSQAAGGTARQTGRQTDLCSRARVIYVRSSSCRTACRQSRRFKAPILPAIAEV